MDFSKLRLSSFKSFVEPIEIDIKDGLTGVVGPNGCGKSNLVEAIRWVMGEASYKSMRASSMEGVIFQGTQNRPSRNSAEVMVGVKKKGIVIPGIASCLIRISGIPKLCITSLEDKCIMTCLLTGRCI